MRIFLKNQMKKERKEKKRYSDSNLSIPIQEYDHQMYEDDPLIEINPNQESSFVSVMVH